MINGKNVPMLARRYKIFGQTEAIGGRAMQASRKAAIVGMKSAKYRYNKSGTALEADQSDRPSLIQTRAATNQAGK